MEREGETDWPGETSDGRFQISRAYLMARGEGIPSNGTL